jgi:F420-dependent oxidoreductase-like protein
MDLAADFARFSWSGGTEALGPTAAECIRMADEGGCSAIAAMDHFFQIPMIGPHDEPMLDGYTFLGFAAGHSERAKLQLLVTGVTYRHPGLLAKIVTTLDVLSGGRARLGIGAAWNEQEHVGLGVPFPSTSERFERLDECLAICRQMWSDDNGPYEGVHYQLAETLNSPQNLTRPHPEIMVGGMGPKKTLRIAARHAQAVNWFPIGEEGFAGLCTTLAQHCADEGTDVEAIRITLTAFAPRTGERSEIDSFLADMETYRRLGVSEVFVAPAQDDPRRDIELWVTELVPRLASL